MSDDSLPRLIEVLMPMEQASILSPKEKNVRSGGYISTFHVWPARRPLAACRAALLATLLPDPGDAAKRAKLLKMIGGEVTKTQKEKKDSDGNIVVDEITSVENGLLKWNVDDNEDMQALRREIRAAAGGNSPRVFDPFAGGGAIPLEAMWLGCDVSASDLNPVAWLLLKGTLEYPQQYAGKKWPLPAFVNEWPDFIESMYGKKKRKKAEKAHFSDPRQMHLHEVKGSDEDKAFTLDAELPWHIRAWGRWVLERATADLSRYYPVVNGEPTVAYLWARTVRDIQTEGHIPVLKSFFLSRSRGKRCAVLPVPNGKAKHLQFCLVTEKDLATAAKRRKIVADNPHLERWGVSEGNLLDFLKRGTKNASGVWSPFAKGRPELVAATSKEVRDQGRRGLMGVQMIAVAVQKHADDGSSRTQTSYRLPTDEELTLAMPEIEEIEEAYEGIPFGIPTEETPRGGGRKASRAFSLQNYGINKWRELFLPRQLLAAGVFVRHTRAAIRTIQRERPAEAEALATYLALIFGKFIDYSCELCCWRADHQEVNHAIAGYKLPVYMDFCEANPLSAIDRFYAGGIRAVSDAVGTFCRSVAPSGEPPDVRCVSSLKMQLPPQDICFTDPPYYDAIPYADLMNFFRIWQKRILGDFNDEFQEIYDRPSPTWDAEAEDGELIDDDARHGKDTEKSRKAYEDGMARAFERSLQTLKDDGRMVVVFANKEVDAWQSLIGAIIRAGALVTASWPIQTEMVNKVTQKRANLSTSVWIVCRKRPANAVPGWEDDVLQRMRTALLDPREELGDKNILRYYFDMGVRGADFLWAALGPALTAYSTHPYVKKTEGGVMDVRGFLDEVRSLVLHFALGALKGFDDTQDYGEQADLELDAVTQYYLLHRSTFAFDPVIAGICIQYANAVGKTDRELQMVWNVIEQGGKKKRTRRKAATTDEIEADDDETGDVLNAHAKADKFKLVAWDERAKNKKLGESTPNHPAPLIDKLHRLMLLLKQNRADEVQAKYEEWGLAGDPAFPRVLQAVRELALQDHQADERRLVESLASQLKMNRRVVMENNLVKETSLFDYSTNANKEPS